MTPQEKIQSLYNARRGLSDLRARIDSQLDRDAFRRSLTEEEKNELIQKYDEAEEKIIKIDKEIEKLEQSIKNNRR